MKTNSILDLKASLQAIKLSLLPLLLLSFTSLAANAVEITVQCTDPDDSSTCSISSSDGTLPTPLLFLTEELLEVAQTEPGGSCVADPNNDSRYTCASASTDLTFICDKDSDNQAVCRFGGDTASTSLLELECSRSTGNDEEDDEVVDGLSSCTIRTNDEQLEALTENIAPGVSGNQARILESIRTVCGAFSAESALLSDCSAFLNLLNDGDFAGASEILQQISPSNASSAMQNARAAIGGQAQNINVRLENIRSNSASLNFFDVSGLAFNLDGQTLQANDVFSDPGFINLAAADAEDAASASAADYGKLGFFLNGSLIFGELDATANQGGSDFSSTGITLGVDYRYTESFVAGMAFGLANSTSDFASNGGEVSADNYGLTLYGSYYKNEYYVDATLGFSSSEFDQQRNLTSFGVTQILSANYFGKQSTVSLGGGANYRYQGWDLNPFVQLASSSIDLEDYEEKASNPTGVGAGWALAIDDQKLNSTLFNLGLQATYVMNKNWGVFIPLLRLELVNELDDDAQVINGRFVGGGTSTGGSFSLATNEVDTSYYNFGFGTTLVMKSGNTAFIYYQTTLGYDDLSQNMINLGWRWEI